MRTGAVSGMKSARRTVAVPRVPAVPAACRTAAVAAVPRMLRLTLFAAVSLLGAGARPTAAQEPEIAARLHGAGASRYIPGRWSTVKGIVSNPVAEPQSILMVVTPPGGQNIQYARQITLPPRCTFETQWPILIPQRATPQEEFRTLVFPGGEEDGIIRRRSTDVGVASFNSIIRAGTEGYTGWLTDAVSFRPEEQQVSDFLKTLRYQGYRETSVVTLMPREFGSFPEALAPLDQLCVTSRRLHERPGLTEAIQLWVQRGGRLVLMLDQSGLDVADLLLGDAFPTTLIGETSSNTIRLDINPDYSPQSFPTREVVREFDEPVRYLRVLAEAGEVIWSVDGWPVAMRVPYGRGNVLITTIEAQAFLVPRDSGNGRGTAGIPPTEFIASSRRMTDLLLNPPQPQLLDPETVLTESARQIGYRIPGRGTAGLLAIAFPLLLLAGGLWLQRRQMGERLLFLLPLTAVAISVPVVTVGMQGRGVAPETTLQTHLIQAIPGQPHLVAEGFAVTYQPDAGPVTVKATDGARAGTPGEADNTDLRRLQWTSPDECHWVNLALPSGIQLIPIQSVFHTSTGVSAVGTFDESGVVGTFEAGEFANPADALFAGAGPTRMSVRWETANRFRIGPDDILRENLYVTGTLLSDDQLTHAALYERVFSAAGRVTAFPEVPSLLCWVDSPDSSVQIGPEDAESRESVLLVQPLRMMPPPVNAPITIPAGFLPFRSIASETGSISAAYNNTQREWVPRENAGTTVLEFLIPRACHPFRPDGATLRLRIRAGSRQVGVFAGARSDLRFISTLSSPIGVYEIPLPADALTEPAMSGRVYVKLETSDLDAAIRDADATGEQDDSWQIEALELTLTGQRVESE